MVTNKRSIPFKVYLTPQENEALQARVVAAGLSRSQYGHLLLTSPFAQQLKQIEERRTEQNDLRSLLGHHYLMLSLLESNLATLNQTPPRLPAVPAVEREQDLLLHQLQTELTALQALLLRLCHHLKVLPES